MTSSRKPGHPFWHYIRSYLTVYLPKIRCLSQRTVDTYRQSIAIYCSFLKDKSQLKFSEICFEHITRDFVLNFIRWLGERNCQASTCNLRLSSLKSFLKYCADEDIALYSVYEEVKRIPMMKAPKTPVEYMSETALKALLAQPDIRSTKGLRNRMIIILLYDTGTRVKEFVEMKVSDLHLIKRNPFVIVTGKGGKPRSIPLMDKTVDHLKEYLKRFHFNQTVHTSAPLFYSMRDGVPHMLSTDTINVLLKNYGEKARKVCFEVPQRVYPHLIRHTRAMHLYQSGMPLSYVAEFLGHSSMNTTEIYASASVEMLREAIKKTNPELTAEIPIWKDEETLKKLCGL